jgi:acetyl esterase/lipase
MGFSRVAVVALAIAVASGVTASARQKEAPAAAPVESSETAIDPNALPVNLRKIQRALSRPPAIRPETTRPVFRVQVFSRSPTIDDILGPDWRKGPTPLGAMTHQEFLDLVTPNDVKGYAAFDNKQGLMVAATSFALKWAVTKALQKLDEAKTDRQKAAARKEVDEALAALKKARREAGLPDR